MIKFIRVILSFEFHTLVSYVKGNVLELCCLGLLVFVVLFFISPKLSVILLKAIDTTGDDQSADPGPDPTTPGAVGWFGLHP